MPNGNLYQSNLSINQTENIKEVVKNEIISYNREKIKKFTEKSKNIEKIKTLMIMPRQKKKSLYSLETDETSKVKEKMKKTKLKLKKVFVSE